MVDEALGVFPGTQFFSPTLDGQATLRRWERKRIEFKTFTVF